MRFSGFVAAAAALAITLATLPADAASERHRRGGAHRQTESSDNIADQLNAQSLQRAQSGMDASTTGTGSSTGSMGMQGGGIGGSSLGSGGMGGSGMGGTSGMGSGGTGTGTGSGGTGRMMR